MATLQEMLGGGLPAGLLSPEQEAMAQQRARSAGLTNLGFALLQASQGRPGQGKPSLGQIIGQAGPVGMQAYQQSFDRTLQELLLQQKMQEQQRQRQQQQQQQQAIETYISSLPPEQQAQFRAFPTQAAEAMFREPKEAKETFRLLTPQEVQSQGLPPGNYQIGSITNKISPVGREQTVVNVGTEKPTPFQEAAQKAQAKTFGEIQDAGIKAQRSLQSVNRLEKILEKVDTGGVAAFKQIAGNFGVKTEGLDNIQAAQAIVNNLVPQQRPPGSGPMSDADLELFKQSLPRVINQPGANKSIIATMKAINKYVVEEGKIASDVLNGKLSPTEGQQKLMELGNPIQDFFEQIPSAAATSPRIQMSPEDAGLINKYLRR